MDQGRCILETEAGSGCEASHGRHAGMAAKKPAATNP